MLRLAHCTANGQERVALLDRRYGARVPASGGELAAGGPI